MSAAGEQAAAALDVRGLEKRFGGAAALAGASLSVPAGSIFGLLGPNGAGKTTLLSIVAGYLAPDAGTVAMLGADLGDLPRLRGRFSLLPQDAELQPSVPVSRQLAFFARLGGYGRSAADAEALRALAEVGLEAAAAKPPRALSHGMRKRAAIAQALIGEPELVLLDEPTAGLDPENARLVRDLIRAMRGRRTAVVSSHNLPEIQELCDRVAILHRGRVAESATLDDLTGAEALVRVELECPLPSAARDALLSLETVVRLELPAPDTLALHLRPDDPAKRDAAVRSVLHVLLDHDAVPRGLRLGASLETRFLEITGRPGREDAET